MAVLHSEVRDGVTYEVRNAGRTLRLYTNGVLHTQYNPGRIWGNGIWDALTYPALLNQPARPPTVLLLGLGGGASLHVLHKLLRPASLVAVEIDATHIEIAQRWFDIDATDAEVHHADANEWLQRSRRRFDIVIDDVFVHAARAADDPYRPVASEAAWRELLLRRLADDGLLIRNHVDPASAREDAIAACADFGTVIECRVSTYCNVVTAAYRRRFDLRAARRRFPGPRDLVCRTVGPRFSREPVARTSRGSAR